MLLQGVLSWRLSSYLRPFANGAFHLPTVGVQAEECWLRDRSPGAVLLVLRGERWASGLLWYSRRCFKNGEYVVKMSESFFRCYAY